VLPILRVSLLASLSLLVGAVIWAAPGGAVSYAPALQTVKPGQVGPIHLGDTIASLSERKLIGRVHPGCELDPGQRTAHLRPPLKGWAYFFHGGKRLSSLSIEAGAETAQHIRVGSTVSEAMRAYPNAEYDRPGSNKPFAEGFLWVDRSAKPKMTFVIFPDTKRVEAIDLPSPNFCE
jgi:hypothetical protein